MIILKDNFLQRDFLEASALQNVRAFLRTAIPGREVRARSHNELLAQVMDQDLAMTPEEFRNYCWDLMSEEFSGNHHVALWSAGPLFRSQSALDPSKWHSATQVAVKTQDVISTGEILDSKFDDGKTLRILYVGEAEAEVHDPNESYHEEVHGTEYEFKAYKQLHVPVFTSVNLGRDEPYITVMTRAIHQKVKPGTEIEDMRRRLEAQLGAPLPPLGDIATGITALWGNQITPRRVDTEESDGTRVGLTKAPGMQNPSSLQVEETVRRWNFKSGALYFDDGQIKAPFSVDAGRATFSFGTRVSRGDAQHVIRTILGATP